MFYKILLVSLAVFSLAKYSDCYRDRGDNVGRNDDRPDDYNEDDDLEEVIDQGPMRVSRTLDIGGGDTAWVIDNALQHRVSRFLSTRFDELTDGIGYTYNHMNYSKADPKQEWNYGSSPWTKQIDLEHFSKMSTWKNIEPVVNKLLNKSVKLQYGEIELLRTLDSMPPTSGKYCAPNRYVLTIFLNLMWNLNNYGQVSFYSNTRNSNVTEKSRLEISETVHPHPYRAILWPSCHTVLFRAPCINYFHHMKYLNIWMTTDMDDKNEIVTPASNAKTSIEETKEFADFHFTNPDANREINFEKHLLRSFYDDSNDRPIHIFDDLFTTDELQAWRNHLLKTRPMSNVFDPTPLEDHDNVQWLGAYNVDSFMKTDMWPRFLNLCKFVSNESDWHPYDVAVNYVRSADHTRIHPDSELHQTELTMVLYLSEGLTPSDYGETTFVVLKPHDGVHEFIGPGGELYESIATVTPKFGRVAIFRNNIEHSAHPPSTQFLGGRYTFALKVSRTKHLAYVKLVYEKMEGVELGKNQQIMNQALMSGSLDDPESVPTEKLEKMYSKIQKKINKEREESRGEALKMSLQEL